MRTPENETERAAHAIHPHPPREPRAMCPPTPPPEIGDDAVHNIGANGGKDDGATGGDSAAALNFVQDRSLYMTSEGAEVDTLPESTPADTCDNDKETAAREGGTEIDTAFKTDVTMLDHSAVDATSMPTPESVALDGDAADMFCATRLSESLTAQTTGDALCADEPTQQRPFTGPKTSKEHDFEATHEDFPDPTKPYTSIGCTASSVRSSDPSATPRFEFSNTRLYPHYPSSFLRPGSKFSGTQQSDRQIYNVDVQILTLSVAESTLTGYLRICGLTEDHPTLTTFFTGEIIGGPNHKHTFQTKDPSWGASDRTDLSHWARFPAWRPLNKDARRDINFKYPPHAIGPGSRPTSSLSSTIPLHTATIDDVEDQADDDANPGWWTQPNIFMRWKEWFLVPDHRVRSIQGASFEGFYYICFNQVEGKIDGIYFHARSEK
ncbi:hypothetical protein EPUS_02507 [Endocarpon pusillum Z07020]|uniref:Vesicle-mediated transport protein Vid24 n=1 Tax=Endocarpon pusillum (strain Z07020 / HMAS-L-300199) TaxID=1263415 RepID=U1GFX9_ENDPU|nr:uncharacterized protein EPUS_02507 [Endocarpon pusillum Z07020]ERF70641.1 hypothetical protein EPUS_02507 [Endocarpon pusillum Z07020]